MATLAPKVLVGCPTHELKADSLDAFMRGLNALTYSHFDVVIEDNTDHEGYTQKILAHGKKWEHDHPGHTFRVLRTKNPAPKARARLVQGRNKIRAIALNENYDYFFSLEQDVVPPIDVIQTLLSRNKDAVSGVYLNRKKVNNQYELNVMAGYFGNEDEKAKKLVRSMGLNMLFPSRVFEIAYAGLGCMLISRAALEKIEFRYDENQQACDDVYFCMDLQAKGVPVFLDSSVLCAHHFNDAFNKTPY